MKNTLQEQLEKQKWSNYKWGEAIIETFECAGCKERTKVDDLWEAGNGKLYCSSCGSEQDNV